MPSLAEQARKQQLARDLAEARDRFERTNFVVAEPDAEAPTLPGKGNKELELLLKKEWLSRVRGVRWSGTDDELKRAYTAERKRRSRPADDGARRVQERRESATQRAAQNATRPQDAMAIVRKMERPSLFVTMTCDPRWPEITAQLKPIQRQKAEERHARGACATE